MAKAGEKHPDPKHPEKHPDPKPTAPAPGEPAIVPAANDPLEGVKIDRPKVIVPPPPPAPPEPPPPPSTPTPERYVVTEKTTVSLDGQFVTLNKDDIISAASYGPRGLQRIKDSNVKMKRIEDLPKDPASAKTDEPAAEEKKPE